MSITANWRSATGFDTTDYTVTMGKPVADCSVEELAANPLCGSVSPFANIAYTATASEMVNNNIVNIGGAAPFTYPITSEHSDTWAIAAKPGDDLRKQYRRTIFVACPSNVQMPAYFLCSTSDSRILIVEDIAYPNKLVINFGNTTDHGANIYRTVNFKVSGVACKHTCNRGQSAYATAPSQVDYEDPDTHTHTYYNIYPVWLYVYEGEAYVVLYEYLCFSGGRYKINDPAENNYNFIQRGNFQSFSQVTPKWLAMGYNPNPGENTTTLHDIFPNGYADPVPTPAVFASVPLEYSPTNLAPDGAGVVYGLQMNNNVTANTYVCRLDITLYTGNQWYRANTMCRVGCYFVNNSELLKPIIQDGIVIGYGTPEEESEIDKYTDLKHPVPSGPGGGGGGGPADDEDNKDPVSALSAPFATGLAHYYITTAASPVLGQIAEAMSTWDIDASKKDLYRNLISCKLVKPPAPVPSTPGLTFEIYGVAPEYQGTPITITGVAGNPTATFGPYSIPRKFNDFRDYAPYTKCEIHLPYCGWCPLPSHVVGRSVYVKYFTDIIAATCKAVVYCYDNPVAEAAGVIGLDIPFAAENVGAKMEAANAGLLAATAGAVQTALGVGTMVSTKGGSGSKQAAGGLSQYVSGFTQMAMAANENWTEICGKNGDGCCLAGLNEIIIKVTRPKFGQWTTAPYVPAGYAHNAGFTSMREVTVGSVTGLLIADNVDTSGISGATERERQLIKNYLESGIIVNPAGE